MRTSREPEPLRLADTRNRTSGLIRTLGVIRRTGGGGMSTRRTTRGARRGRRAVGWPAILTLLVLALAGLTAPGATALPRVAAPPKPPVYTDEQLAQIVLDDPRLR